jgi:hypothetical protein
MTPALNRRELLKWGVAGAAALAVPSLAASPAAAATARFPGHKPGQVYLGMSSPMSWDAELRQVGQFGLKRTFHGWGELSAERKQIVEAHNRGILPWISFGSVGSARGGWRAIANGAFDADIRARAQHYAGLSRPVIVTFCHEPHNKLEGTRADWANAFVRISNVMNNTTGRKNVIYAPIIGDWEFNPINKKAAPREFLTNAVLDRCHFLGTDIYQNESGRPVSERLGYTMSWLGRYGYGGMMVGLGELGATNKFGSPKAAAFFNDAWGFVRQNRDRVAAVSYFNSSRHSKSWVYWPLDESNDKLQAYRDAIADSVSCTL